MSKIEPEPSSMPDINPDKVCFVVEKSRELQSEDEGAEADASNPSDDDARRVLTDEAYAPIRAELAEFIDDLDIDEQCALVALTWIGRGDFDPPQWEEAVALAAERRGLPVSDYLIGLPLLPDYLEEALAAYDCSCRDFGALA
ncbi:MAG: DUF3775 domain-containing protein [Roseiarcus sp.]